MDEQDELTPYRKQFHGAFTSLLKWEKLTEFWKQLCAGDCTGWYIYAIGETVPTEPATEAKFRKFIPEVDQLLRNDHQERVCGIVYANNLDAPTMIKIYDPNHLGLSCGSSPTPTLPGWVLSKIPPEDLEPTHVIPQNRRHWWQQLFHHG